VPSISKIKGASGARNAITVNASANGWSKRSDSGERDMHAPAGEKSSRPSPSANDPLLYYPSKESTAVAIRKKGSEMRRVTSNRTYRQETQQMAQREGKSCSPLQLDIWYTTG